MRPRSTRSPKRAPRSRPNSRTSPRRRSSGSRGQASCGPASAALAIAQDRITEKRFCTNPGSRRRRSAPSTRRRSSERRSAAIRSPALLKTSRLGYDGKGQAAVDRHAVRRAAFERFGGVPCVLEERLTLETGALGRAGARRGRRRRRLSGRREPAPATASSRPRSSRPRVPERLARGGPGSGDRRGGADRRTSASSASSCSWRTAAGSSSTRSRRGRTTAGTTPSTPAPSDQFEQQVRALCGLPLGEPRGCSRRSR